MTANDASSEMVASENGKVPTAKLLLTINEVAEMTGLSVGTLYHWVSEKRIPIVRFSSRCVRFRRADIEQWIAGQVIGLSDQDDLPEGIRADGRKTSKALNEAI